MRIEHEEICTIKEVGQAIKISTPKREGNRWWAIP